MVYKTTIIVPEDRKIVIQLPPDFPVGKAILTITPIMADAIDNSDEQEKKK